MTFQRIACLSIGIVITSSIAAGQSPTGATDQGPASKVIERTYSSDMTPWRVVSTRTTSGGKEVVIETVESPDVDGKMSPIQETVTEKTRPTSTTEQTKREVFVVGADGRRRLFETTESQHDTLVNGDANTIHNTFTQDLNGRPALTSRTVEQTRAVGPAVRQLETTLMQPDPNEALHETTRAQNTERRIDPRVVRYDSAQLVRDVNGRWQPIETRSREARETGVSDRLDEQTTQRLDINGRLAPVERTVSRGSSTNVRDEAVIESYVPFIDRLPDSGSGLALSERVNRTTTKNADGGSSTIEEVEGRNLAAPGEGMRMIRRTVTTVRPVGTDRWVTEREVFERDVNGRMQRVSTEIEQSSGK
jgi:hypothetical protein